MSRRVHSRYERRLLDTAAGGCEVVIYLTVRRFRCLSAECGKPAFAGQGEGLAGRHARRTPAVTAVLEAVALALGGRAGARLSGRLAAGVSGMTMIRLVRAMPLPAVDSSPRVLGVDEFALRKGRRYGTLLVDVETRRPAGIIDERPADSFADWLEERPGTEVICRDRSGVCSDGGARGAPGAVQVADRWHRWHNLGEAVERAVSRHRGYLPAAIQPPDPPAEPSAEPAAPAPPLPRTGGAATRTRDRHAGVHRMLAEGRTLAQITRDLGLSRGTVRRFARAGARRNCWSTTAPADRPASSTSTPPTCASDGTPAAPTPPGYGPGSATAATPAARPTSASTSRVSAETSPSPNPSRRSRKSRP